MSSGAWKTARDARNCCPHSYTRSQALAALLQSNSLQATVHMDPQPCYIQEASRQQPRTDDQSNSSGDSALSPLCWRQTIRTPSCEGEGVEWLAKLLWFGDLGRTSYSEINNINDEFYISRGKWYKLIYDLYPRCLPGIRWKGWSTAGRFWHYYAITLFILTPDWFTAVSLTSVSYSPLISDF